MNSALFTGIAGNYLKPSIRAAGMDPDALDAAGAVAMDFSRANDQSGAKPKAWSQIWGAGQGIGAVKAVVPAAALVDRLAAEYLAARQALCGGASLQG